MSELPNKVKAALANLSPFKKVVVGLSGGLDSTVLTHCLRHLGYDVVVAHLNHCLRGKASDEDEAFVIESAKAWKLPYLSKKAAIPKQGNLEAMARKVRYAYLEEVRQAYEADYIAVGHHFDDQIETILMHEKRGSGLRGRRGMKLQSGKILRPLIDISRHEIEAYAKEHLLDFVVDSSNEDMNFERNRLRKEVIPKLKKDPNFEKSIRNKAALAAEKLEALHEEAQVWKEACFKDNHFKREDFKSLHKDLKAEILIELLGQQDLYGKTIGRLINFIETSKTGKEVMVKDKRFIIEYGMVRMLSSEAADLPAIDVSEKADWGDYQIAVKDMKLKVRSWQPGDRFQPSGMQGSKKLQDFFVDAKIPRHERKRIPIILDEKNDIIAVGNLRFSEKFKHLKDAISVQKQND